jgi:AraC-like DNA-binding protein
MEMRSQFLCHLLEWMRRSGAADAADSLTQEHRLPPPNLASVPEMTLPLHTYRHVCEQASAMLGERFLGLHVARELPRGSYGLVEFAARSAPNLGEALTRVANSLRLFSGVIEMAVGHVGEHVVVTHRIPEEPLAAGCQGNEYALAALLCVGRNSSGRGLCPVAVDFAHPSPGDDSELRAFFGTEQIHFEQRENRLAFHRDVLSLPVTSYDAALLAALDQQLGRMLTESVEAPGLLVAVQRRIRIGLANGEAPTLRTVAEELRLGHRTLQRRLEERGTSYFAELERVRCEFAIRYLASESCSLAEVATRLGYANQTAFERAFRRWRQVTPAQYRRCLC